jgi:hypothetical protein
MRFCQEVSKKQTCTRENPTQKNYEEVRKNQPISSTLGSAFSRGRGISVSATQKLRSLKKRTKIMWNMPPSSLHSLLRQFSLNHLHRDKSRLLEAFLKLL